VLYTYGTLREMSYLIIRPIRNALLPHSSVFILGAAGTENYTHKVITSRLNSGIDSYDLVQNPFIPSAMHKKRKIK
jgi:hypothetical protein